MPTISRQVGSTSNIIPIFIFDSTVATGAGKTGLTNASVTAYYKRNKDATATSISLTGTGTLGTFTSGLFKLVDDTNMPGEYEFHPPDTAFASGSDSVSFLIKGTGIAPCRILVELTATSNQDVVRGGMTALPNVVSGSAGAVITSGTGTAQLSVASGLVSLAADQAVNTTKWAGTSITATSIPVATAAGASGGLLISGSNAGTTTFGALTVTGATTLTGAVTATAGVTGNIAGNLSGSVGSVSGNVSGSVGSVVAGIPTTTQIATAVWQDATAGDFTTPSSIGLRLATGIPAIAPGAADGLFKAGTNAATTVTTAFTTTFTGNLTGNVGGSVASVTGAVTVTGTPAVNVTEWGGAAIATPNVAGYPLVDASKWVGGTIPAVNVTGVPKVDLVDWLGSAPSALSSGLVQATKTGYSLAAAGLDSITIETGLNARQALSMCSAALAGTVSGAPTGPVIVKACNDNATTRVSAVVDANGNRTPTLTIPT